MGIPETGLIPWLYNPTHEIINKKVEWQKSILTSFWEGTAPESWSKYTTRERMRERERETEIKKRKKREIGKFKKNVDKKKESKSYETNTKREKKIC